MKNKSLNSSLLLFLSPIIVLAQLRNPINIPLNFYGKVIDQEGRPVVGATVSLEAQANYFEENRSEQKPFVLKTDQNGHFSLKDAYGAIVTIKSGSVA
jgi:hypothetical protein